MSKDSHKTILDFVLDRALSEPARKRVELYRALADIAGDQVMTRDLLRLAAELDAADRRCREFTWRNQEDK